ncbi:MAG: PAS domain-containing protein, partial [Actinomycetota bacterium]|nr:PAS domain-containing protein [Actinomycetota bacterium]
MSIFGYSKITNHPNEWMRRVHPDDLKEVEAAITAHVRGKTDLLNTTHRMLHADGTYRWVLVRASAARAGNGEAYRIAGSHMDITKLRNTEALLNGIHDDSDAVQVAERVRTVMRRPLVVTGGEVASTVTIGIAEARPAAAG